MQYKFQYLFILGLLFLFAWTLSYWKFFYKGLVVKNHYENKFKFGLKGLNYLIGAIGILYISYSLMMPRKPLSYSENTKNVKDIFLVVDVSRSMLATDLSPNRLTVAKEKLEEFARLRPKDRIGIILFSEKVFTLLPLSTDSDLITKYISDINVGLLGSGTNIGDALGLAVARSVASETKSKVVILLTDGVSNVGNMTPLDAAKEAKENNIKVYTIGLGSDGEARIPIGRRGFFGGTQRIPGGSIDLKTLKQISSMTNAKSFKATNRESLKEILYEIEKLERTEIKINNQRLFDEQYFKYLLIGFFLFAFSEVFRKIYLREVS